MSFWDGLGNIGKFLVGIPQTKNVLGALGVTSEDTPHFPLLAPPLPPDATDEQIKQAVLMQRRKLLLGQGQGSTFLSGPLGDTSAFMTAPNKAGGF